VPARHDTHTDAPDDTPVKEPALQMEHVLLDAPSAALNVPVAHSTHADSAEEPGAVLYLPAPHSEHADTPVEALLYLPAAHAEHTDAPSRAPVADPAGQVTHVFVEAPEVALYLPVAHGVHAATEREPTAVL
jgi:hypothetical protein